MAAFAEQIAISVATVKSMEEEMAAMASASEAPPPPTPPSKAYKFVPRLPTPKSWKEEELRSMVLNRTIPTAVADAGASSNCGAAPLVSTCGNFEIKEDPFLPTGK